MLRPLRIAVEIVAAFVGVIAVLGGILAWRLSTQPIHSAFLTPYLEAGIESIVPGTDVQLAHTLLTWDNDGHSVALHVDGLRVTEKNGGVIADVPALDIQLSAIGILFGRFLPTELMIDHPQIKLERWPDGSFTFGGMAPKGDSGGDMKGSLARITSHLAHAYFTHKLKIDHAVFDVHDTATNSDWSVHIPEIALDRSGRDLNGHLSIDVAQKEKTSTIEVRYIYDRAKSLHRLTSRFSGITPAFFAGGHPATLGLGGAAMFNLPLTGEVTLAFDGDLNIASGVVDLHGNSGFLNNAALWDKPRAVKSLDIKADYDRQDTRLDISSAAVDFGGPRLTLSAVGRPAGHILHSTDMDLGFSVQLDNWPIDQYATLWPKPLIADAREWMVANLSKGKFDHAEGVFKGTLDMNDPENLTLTEGKGKVLASGATVKYVDSMPPVEGVSAEGDFDLGQMTVHISGGGIGDVRLMPFALVLSGFEDKVQNIDIPLKVAGPIPSILRLIDYPPLGYTKAIGLKPEDISGTADATVTFHFPLLKNLAMKDIGVKAEANLSGTASSKLMENVDITQGNLALALDAKGFEVTGPAVLNKVPFQIDWKQNFGDEKPYRQATLTGGVTADQWQTLGIGVFNGTRGPVNVTLEMTQPDKTAMLLSGMLDMTAAETHIDQLNWKKPAGQTAVLKFTAEKTEDNDIITVKSIEAHGPQMNIKGNASLSAGTGRLVSLNLAPMVIGRTNASLRFSGPKDEKDKDPMHFEAEGQAFDVSGIRGGKDPERTSPQPKEYKVDIGKLYTSDVGFIANAKGHAIRDLEGWSEISLHGLADGGHQLDIDLAVQKDGNRTFTLSCDDFGKALKGMGFTDTVRDGKLYIYGESDPDNPRTIAGEAKIGHFTVGHLPVLAVLMNAASPFGFAGLFSGNMDFDDLKGKFRWSGDEVHLIGIHAAGAAVGLNIDGRVDMSSGDANLHGTMVPFSVMNGIINEIPLIGSLITGGKGQGVFAVSYNISGPLADPHIGVNPVSLLTPGFLRNLIFGESDEDEAPEKKPAVAH